MLAKVPHANPLVAETEAFSSESPNRFRQTWQATEFSFENSHESTVQSPTDLT
jgi:hypothetical protein